MRRFVALIAVCCIGHVKAAPPPDLDEQVQRALSVFGAPALALAVVEDGRTVHAKGYGLRRLGEGARADEHTIFPIGSCTKAFTAAALGVLVDDGKLTWDDKVTDRLPGFRMYDPYTTSELTIRDLLVHRSGLGLGAGDLMFYPPTTFTRKEIVHRLRYLKPATSFRSGYAYDNVLYIVAGEVVEAVSGLSWEEFVERRIFAPLEMKDATTRGALARKRLNRAHGHGRIEGPVRGMGPIKPFPTRNANVVGTNSAPAGSISASATDMAQWMKAQLGGGAVNAGERLFSESVAREMWTPHTIMPAEDAPPILDERNPNLLTYALGWEVTDYRGHRLVVHTGGVEGGAAVVGFLPEKGIGVAVMINSEDGAARYAVFYHVLDHYLKVSGTDWIARYKQALDAAVPERLAAVRESPAETPRGPGPSLPLEKYAGVYRDAWYGTISISHGSSGLRVQFDRTPRMQGAVEHVRYDTFRTRWVDKAIEDAYITFALNPDGSIDQMRMQAISPFADFSFDFHDLLFKPVADPAGRVAR